MALTRRVTALIRNVQLASDTVGAGTSSTAALVLTAGMWRACPWRWWRSADTVKDSYPGSRYRAPNPRSGLSRAITRLPALARFAPRFLILDLADQVSTHFREGMINVALVGGGHEVRPSRQPGLKGDLLVRALGVFQ
jgi:hypothetical protein